MIWIIDASAAIEIVLGRKHSKSIGAILQDAEEVIAPDLFIAETANVFWKYFRFEGLSKDDYIHYTKMTHSLSDEFIEHTKILDKALYIALLHEVTVYDALYLALASMIEGAGIVSLDKKMRKTADSLQITVNSF